MKRIGAHTVKEYLTAIDPLIGRENDMRLRLRAALFLRCPAVLHAIGLIPSGGELPLTLQTADGNERELKVPASLDAPLLRPNVTKDWATLQALSGAPVPLYLKNPTTSYWFEYIPETRLLYFQFNQTFDDNTEPFAKFVDRMFDFARQHPIEKMVIDLRFNGGGNTVLVSPLINALIKNDNINREGKLFVIIGRVTYSAAMNTADFLERNTNAIFVGEPSGASPNFYRRICPPHSALQQTRARHFGFILGEFLADRSPQLDCAAIICTADDRRGSRQSRSCDGSNCIL